MPNIDKMNLEELEELLAKLRVGEKDEWENDLRILEHPEKAEESQTTLLEIFRRERNLSLLFARAKYGVEQRGRELFRQRLVTLVTLEESAAAFEVASHWAQINYVTLLNTNGAMRGIEMTCECPEARRWNSVVCEHKVAAALMMQQLALAEEQQAILDEIPWETRLSTALTTSKATKVRKPRAILLFSLQEQYTGAWKLVPFTLPTSLVQEEVLEDRVALSEAITRLGQRYEITEITAYGQQQTHLLHSTPELCSLARVLAIANVYANNALPFILPHMRDVLLFRSGNVHGSRFAHAITQVDTDPRPLRMELESNAAGLRMLPSVPDGDGTLILRADDTHIVNLDPLWLLVGNRLLRVEGDGTLLKGILQAREIVIPEEEKGAFTARYLPKLLSRTEVTGDFVHQREDVHAEPAKRVYLSEANDEIVAELAFVYGEYELPVDTSWAATAMRHDAERDTLITIHRQTDVEEEAWRALSEFGLKRDGERFLLRQRVTPFEFLLRSVPRMQAAGYEVFGEDAIKSARVNRHKPTMRMVVSSGIDWFDVKTVINYGELEVSLAELRKAIKQRQGYVKLPDGSLGEIPQEWLDRYRHLLSIGEETAQGVRLSKTQATLLEVALQAADVAQVDDEYNRRVAQLRDFTHIVSRPLPAEFSGELRPYQQAGYEWLHFLHDYGFGGCLADDMGIGKTVQTLVFLQSLYASGHTGSASLIVMPRSILENWAREAARFTPNLKVLIHADSDRDTDPAVFDQYHLVLTTYGVMLRDVKLFNRYGFHYLVLDEAQAIKNPGSQTARAARLLKGEHRLALTGTPVENSTEELWSLFAFLNPGQLGPQEFFRAHFATPIQRNQDEKVAALLRAMVHPFILRRTKEQVAPELPPRTERIIYCEMTPAQRKIYQRTRDKYRAELLGLIDDGGMQEARFKVLEGLLRLRQLANDPRLVDNSFKGMSSKFEALIETLEVLRDEGHKALIFSQFTSMLALLRTSIDARQWPYLYLDGRTKHRQELVDRFQTDDSIPFFLISLKAGGLGLNLTAADYVVHIDPWWNPAVERQATDRTHRIGQERPVMVYKYIARESVEEKILLLQEKKQALVDQLISTESSFMKSLTREDVDALFT